MSDDFGRSYALKNQYAVVYTQQPLGDDYFGYVVVHELGHAFAGLADEYLEAGKNVSPEVVDRSINCDIDSGCSKWSGTPGTEYERGCYYSDSYYRSIDHGIMKERSADFGVVNIDHINWLFESYLP